MSRSVTVDWLARPGSGEPNQVDRNIHWASFQQAMPGLRTLLIQLPIVVNEQTLTEQAAIGVMALLIHALEGMVLQTVLPIGSGGDYPVQIQEGKARTQVEVRGIRRAETAAVSKTRLAEKRTQVLKQSKTGYASVTTFAYAAGPVVHSYLHHVRRAPTKKGAKKRKKP